ncbi:MAG: hypothetical protein ACM3JH_14480 [Acidithiobacillales bacterium]
MLTGFNTDIKHAERVYHIQTEDRGLSNPVVESLVYVGGEILLSKKSPYAKHIHGDKIDEKAVRELMDLQHRAIIEAIRRGRFDARKPGEEPGELGDDVLPAPSGVSPAAVAAVAAILSAPAEPLPGDPGGRRAAARERSGTRRAVAKVPAAQPSVRPATAGPPKRAPVPAADERVVIGRRPVPDGIVETVVTPHPSAAARPVPPVSPEERPVQTPALRPAIPMPPPAAQLPRVSSPTPNPFPSAVAPAVKAAEPPAPRPDPGAAEAPRRTPAVISGPRTLDQVIVDYLASEAASERLEIAVMAGSDFMSGATVPLTVIASTSMTRKPVPGAQITVRVVSTAGPPQILFRGLTGNDGMVKTSCVLPDIGGANGALIVVGFSPIGSSESKFLLRKKT